MAPPGIKHNYDDYMDEDGYTQATVASSSLEEHNVGRNNNHGQDDDKDEGNDDDAYRVEKVALARKAHRSNEAKRGDQENTTPNEYDVYMGRGGLMNRFRNGSLYRTLIVENFEEYQMASFKRDFALERIIKPIQKKGGRFFVPTPDMKGWMQGDVYEVIAPKVMQALRDCKKEDGNRVGHIYNNVPVKSPSNTKSKNANKKPKHKAKKRPSTVSSNSTATSSKKKPSSTSSAASFNHPANVIRKRLSSAMASPTATPSPKMAKMNHFAASGSYESYPTTTMPQATAVAATTPPFLVASSSGTSSTTTTSLPAGGFRHNLLLSPLTKGPLGQKDTTMPPSTAPKSPPDSTKDDNSKTKVVLLNESGHMMNTFHRTTGVCGFYHFLLSNFFHTFQSLGEEDEGRFIWDNIVSPLQKQGATFMVCPKSGKVHEELSHKTISYIAKALRDTEYIQSECATPLGQTSSSSTNNSEEAKSDSNGRCGSNNDPTNSNVSNETTMENMPVATTYEKDRPFASRPSIIVPKLIAYKHQDDRAFAVARRAVMSIFKKKDPTLTIDVPNSPLATDSPTNAAVTYVADFATTPGQTPAAATDSNEAPRSTPPMLKIARKASSTTRKSKTASEAMPISEKRLSVSTAKESTVAMVQSQENQNCEEETVGKTLVVDTVSLEANSKSTSEAKTGDVAAGGTNNFEERGRSMTRRQSAKISTSTTAPPFVPATRSNSLVTKSYHTRQKREAATATVTPDQSSGTKSTKSQDNKSLDPDMLSLQQKVAWEERYRELIAFAKKHGHCNVPQRHDENPPLGRFVKINRQYWVRNRQGGKSPLTPEREALLDAIGFCWDMREHDEKIRSVTWNANCRALQDFKRKHGHCNVPSQDPKYDSLYRWIIYVRTFKTIDSEEDLSIRREILTPEKEEKLNALGFEWTDADDDYKQYRLKESIDRITIAEKITVTTPIRPPIPVRMLPTHAVAPVPIAKKDKSPNISTPPGAIKGTANNAPLDDKKSNYGNNKNWAQCFNMLSCFKQENGHTQVPYKRFPHNHPLTVLSKFALEMRRHKSLKDRGERNNLTNEREDLLNSIGFEWITNFECTKEGAKIQPASRLAVVTTKLIDVSRARPKKKTDGTGKRKERDKNDERRKVIIDSEGTKWSVYKPLSVEKLFIPANMEEEEAHRPQSLPERPPTPENWGANLTYETDGSDDSVTF